MKIKHIFETEKINDEVIMVSINSEEFNGLLRMNSTAEYIIKCLEQDISEDELVGKIIKRYNIDYKVALNAVTKIVKQLDEMNLIINNHT